MKSCAEDWDVICVGAGITSLAFAAQLVQKDPSISVLVLEKHLVPGGYASIFRRPKQSAVFDCSLHKLSGVSGEGNLIRIFRDMNLDAALEFVYPDVFFEARLPGRTIKLPNSVEGVKRTLSDLFPEDIAGLNQFFEEVETHGRNAYFQFQMLSGTYDAPISSVISQLRYALKNLKPLTVAQALDQRIKSEELREILGLPCGYVGGHPEDLGYFYYLHIIYATLYCGNAYVKGASQTLSDRLVDRIRAGASEVKLQTRVEKIIVDDQGVACGVKTNRGLFRAPKIYINASPHYAVENLFEENADLASVKEKLKGLVPSWSTLTLYLVIDAPPADLGLECTETFLIEGLNSSARELRASALTSGDQASIEDAFWRASPIEITNYHALDPSGGRVVILNLFDKIDHWPQRKTAAYKSKKKRAKEIVLSRFIFAFPKFAGRIKYAEVSSPRTYVKYTNNTEGAGYGALVSTELNPHLFHHGFPIGGVKFMSAWVAGPSYEAAFGYAESEVSRWGGPTAKAFAAAS